MDPKYYLEQSGIKLPGHKKRAAKKAAKKAEEKQMAIMVAVSKRLGFRKIKETYASKDSWSFIGVGGTGEGIVEIVYEKGKLYSVFHIVKAIFKLPDRASGKNVDDLIKNTKKYAKKTIRILNEKAKELKEKSKVMDNDKRQDSLKSSIIRIEQLIKKLNHFTTL